MSAADEVAKILQESGIADLDLPIQPLLTAAAAGASLEPVIDAIVHDPQRGRLHVFRAHGRP